MAEAPLDLPALLAGLDEDLAQLQSDIDDLNDPVIASARKAIAATPALQGRLNDLRGTVTAIRKLCV